MIFFSLYLETLLSPWPTGHPTRTAGGAGSSQKAEMLWGTIPMELACCWDAVALAGAPWGQPLLKTLLCLSSLGPQDSGNLRQAVLGSQGSG